MKRTPWWNDGSDGLNEIISTALVHKRFLRDFKSWSQLDLESVFHENLPNRFTEMGVRINFWKNGEGKARGTARGGT
jgi:hypothetical protein